jgi:hypothetical protein
MTREERWREAVDRYFAPAGMALADVEVAAAVAAVRADMEALAVQIESRQVSHAAGKRGPEAWNDALRFAAAAVRSATKEES